MTSTDTATELMRTLMCVCDRTPTNDAWKFADTGVTRAVSIMAYCESTFVFVMKFICHRNIDTMSKKNKILHTVNRREETV